jgi:hypothetical protein
MLLRYAGANHSIADELEKEFGQNLKGAESAPTIRKEAAIGAMLKALPWKEIGRWVLAFVGTAAAEEAIEALILKIREKRAKQDDPEADIEVTEEPAVGAEPVIPEPEFDIKDDVLKVIEMIEEGYEKAKEGGPKELARFVFKNQKVLRELLGLSKAPPKEAPPAEEEEIRTPPAEGPSEAEQMEEMLSPEAYEPIPFSASER